MSEFFPHVVEYDNIISGMQKRFTASVTMSEEAVKEIGRHAFSYYLRWTPYEVRDKLNNQILEMLQLRHLFKKYLPMPYELDPSKDFFYYAHVLYPELFKYDVRDMVLRVYRDLIAGRRKNYTKNFFDDDNAIERACICLQDAISHMTVTSSRDLYEFFSKKSGMEFLSNVKLENVCRDYFQSPLLFLHEALPDTMKSEFWLNYYTFKQQYI